MNTSHSRTVPSPSQCFYMVQQASTWLRLRLDLIGAVVLIAAVVSQRALKLAAT